MEITIHNTNKIVHLNGLPARVWEGQTAQGTHIYCFITRLALHESATADEQAVFDAELQATQVPSQAVQAIPLSMIL